MKKLNKVLYIAFVCLILAATAACKTETSSGSSSKKTSGKSVSEGSGSFESDENISEGSAASESQAAESKKSQASASSKASAVSKASSGAESKSEPVKINPNPPQTTYKVIYNSDTTHITGCVSPYNTAKGSSLTANMLDASVKEAAEGGADCYAFAPGVSWVPWWPSEEFPATEHANWFINVFKGKNTVNTFYDYAFNNPRGIPYQKFHDIVQEQIDSCRKYKVGAFFSYRMNDAHGSANTTPQTANISSFPRFKAEHPEMQIGTTGLYDYRFAEYREFRLKMIKEIIKNYELDGIELDFMRWYNLFDTGKTTSAERVQIMTAMLKEIRTALNEATKKDGRYRHLSVRIPAWTTIYDSMGVDLKQWANAGVTIFNCSASYFTVDDSQIDVIKKAVPNSKVFYELCHTSGGSMPGDQTSPLRADKATLRRTTAEQLYTAANLAYSSGADGISLFNFQYYRGIPESPNDGPGVEPPFSALKNLGDKSFVAKASQHYFQMRTFNQSYNPNWSLPKSMSNGSTASFTMKLLQPSGGWSSDGMLRLQSEAEMGNAAFTVKINGTTLSLKSSDPGEPYTNPYPQLQGTANTRRCYTVPKGILKSGQSNTIEVRHESGKAVILNYIDLSIK